MAILLKTTLVRVSSIQIMQIRVQNKGKRVWKSRYDEDVSQGVWRCVSVGSHGIWLVLVFGGSILDPVFVRLYGVYRFGPFDL